MRSNLQYHDETKNNLQYKGEEGEGRFQTGSRPFGANSHSLEFGDLFIDGLFWQMKYVSSIAKEHSRPVVAHPNQSKN